MELTLGDRELTSNSSAMNVSLKNLSNSLNAAQGEENVAAKDYWALLLVLFPFFTVFGNVLVILSVYRERTLQTVTNYFIVSLAVADLLVAALVMPFAVYVLVNVDWGLPPIICDFYMAMDVTCSTSSIFNLVAISIDRYIAVTQPIKYARHKNRRRVWLTIVLVWLISAAIGSPIVLGLNHTPARDPTLCLFYNVDFVIYSSLSSFYIPCLIMVFLYYKIFKAIRLRAKKAASSHKRVHLDKSKKCAETVLGTSPLATIAKGSTMAASSVAVIHKNLQKIRRQREYKPADPTSGSQDEDDEDDKFVEDPDAWDECSAVPREDSTDLFLMEQCGTSRSFPRMLNGEDLTNSMPGSPGFNDRTNVPHPQVPEEVQTISKSDGHRDSKLQGSRTHWEQRSNKETKATSRFTIYKVNKASRKKREKSSAKKERKATKTLAIVLGVFLVCWVPFFTCNILDAICTKLQLSCQPGMTAFLLTTWLGYINSFINPVIYTIFNLEFRKAFKRLLHCSD